MTTPRRWNPPLLLPRRLCGALAVMICLYVGGTQAADTGPRHHARGEYDAATATYVVAAGDDLGAIAERLEIPVAELMRENHLKTTVINVGQKLTVAGGTPPAATGVQGKESATGTPPAPPRYMPDIPAKITTP